MTMLLIAGIAVLAAGLMAVAFGIPVKEFSFGNTLILAGAAAACTGVIMLGLAVVVRELQNIAKRLGPADNTTAAVRAKSDPQLPAAAGDHGTHPRRRANRRARRPHDPGAERRGTRTHCASRLPRRRADWGLCAAAPAA